MVCGAIGSLIGIYMTLFYLKWLVKKAAEDEKLVKKAAEDEKNDF